MRIERQPQRKRLYTSPGSTPLMSSPYPRFPPLFPSFPFLFLFPCGVRSPTRIPPDHEETTRSGQTARESRRDENVAGGAHFVIVRARVIFFFSSLFLFPPAFRPKGPCPTLDQRIGAEEEEEG